MEIIWLIILITGSLFYNNIKKNLSTPDEDNDKQGQIPMNEVFPSVEVLPDTEHNPMDTGEKPPRKRVVSYAQEKVNVPLREEEEPSRKNNDSKRISIKTKSEAKRAFIYSEIFNRKY